MKGYIANIEHDALDNHNFRKVVYTTNNSQIVLMSLLPGEDIGEEVHDVDQFLRVEKGNGYVVLNGKKTPIQDGSAILVPQGMLHNIVNAGDVAMKLYTIYMPPHHKDGTIHMTKSDAEHHEEHFDGVVSA